LFSSILARFQLDAIPTVGSGGWLGSWLAGFKYLTNALDVMQEGYDKVSLVLWTFHARSFTWFQHKPAPFKVAELFHWIVVISSREHLEELWRAPDDTLSFAEALNDASTYFLWGGWTGNLCSMSPTATLCRAHDGTRNSP
jgi:hypothetical protein